MAANWSARLLNGGALFSGRLEDPNRIFLSSPFVRHECCPMALFNKRHLEYRFYREYFQRSVMFNDVRPILERASREAARSGVSAMDSFHLVAAHLLSADRESAIIHLPL